MTKYSTLYLVQLLGSREIIKSYFEQLQRSREIIEQASIEDLIAIRAALTQVANGRVPKPNFGICLNTDALLPNTFRVSLAYPAVSYFSHGWQHHSGNINYPVPAPADVYCGLWEGEQLVLRQHLLAYLVDQITLYIERNGDAD